MAYCTLADLRLELDINDNSAGAARLNRYLVQAQKIVETTTRRKFEGAASDRKFDAHEDVEGAMLWVYRAGDLCSITSITNGNGDSVAASAYVTDPSNAVVRAVPIRGIRLKHHGPIWWRPLTGGYTEDAITVNGVWAYSATAPDDIKQAVLDIAATLYKLREATGDLGRTVVTPGGTLLPQGVSQLTRDTLNHYKRGF